MVLEMKLSMPNGDCKTQRDIAIILSISRSYVSRIEKKAIGKLGNNLSLEDRYLKRQQRADVRG